MKQIPRATYRIQFTPAFGFKEALEILDYLSHLGVSCLYASPIFKARKGSTHGYDMVDPNELNPDLGTVAECDELMTEVRRRGMMWLQDIVPNHMAFDAQNQVLGDVLENGPNSRYFRFFDVEWDHPYGGIKGRVLAPFLGSYLGECLENGEIRLHYGPEGFTIHYYDRQFPVRIESYATILTHRLPVLRRKVGREHPDYIKYLGILGVLYGLRMNSAGARVSERHDQISFVKVLLWELYSQHDKIRAFLEANLRAFNGDAGPQVQRKLLENLLLEQFYRLSFWKVAAEEINYRRFFTINDLISLRVEDPEILDHCHALIFRFIAEGKIAALRVDHVDGLHDPTLYLHTVRARTGEIYTVVEKILAVDETLPGFWPIDGTTGYDFLNALSGVFCEQRNEKVFDRIYAKWSGPLLPYDDLVAEKKTFIARKRMAGEVDNLAHLMKNIASRYRQGSDLTLLGLKRAIILALAHFPVYRTYLSQECFRRDDQHYVRRALAAARLQNPEQAHELDFVEKLLLQEFVPELTSKEREEWVHVVMRFQQLSAPLMAKGLEDTVLYLYNRFIALNEVGGSPNRFGVSLRAFHDFNGRRARYHPHTMNATSTHDVKRGEDVRARLNVLSEIPNEWERIVRAWRKANRKHKRLVNGTPVPEPNVEYFLYQTLVGAFPFGQVDQHGFLERIKAYMMKALREGKMVTSWMKPDADYEEACLAFVERILDPGGENLFMKLFLPFQQKVADWGTWNSLSQVLIKITSPGVPDFYQGTELWDLHLVDPDNRMSVDFATRRAMLAEITTADREGRDLLPELLAARTDGRIKLYLIHKALQVRKRFETLFQRGTYLPLRTGGKWGNHLLAFARKYRKSWAVTVAPRFLTRLVKPNAIPIGEEVWHDTHLVCPKTMPHSWLDPLTGEVIEGSPKLAAGVVLKRLPVALLTSSEP